MADRDALIQAALESLGWHDEDPYAAEKLRDAAADVVDVVLTAVYWRHRDHAAALRDTKSYRSMREATERNRDDERAARRWRSAETRIRGIDDAGRDIADLLGLAEWEIERPDAEAAGGTR